MKLLQADMYVLESVQDFLIKLDMKPCKYASSGNKHFFTKLCHFQTYKIINNLLELYEEYLTKVCKVK